MVVSAAAHFLLPFCGFAFGSKDSCALRLIVGAVSGEVADWGTARSSGTFVVIIEQDDDVVSALLKHAAGTYKACRLRYIQMG